MSAEPMVTVEQIRQKLTGILGRLDLAMEPDISQGTRMIDDLRAARRAAEDLARMCDDAERAWRGHAEERLREALAERERETARLVAAQYVVPRRGE